MNEHGLHNSNEATRTLLNKGHNRSFHLNFKNIFFPFSSSFGTPPHRPPLPLRYKCIYRRGQYFIHNIYYERISVCSTHTHSNAHGAQWVCVYIYYVQEEIERKSRSLCGCGGRERNVKAAHGIEPLGNDRASRRRRSAAVPLPPFDDGGYRRCGPNRNRQQNGYYSCAKKKKKKL